MQAVILCAGKSTRTYPLTLTRPKPLLPLIDRTILEWNLSEMSGIVDEVVLVVGYRAEMIREKIGDRYGDVRVLYCEQREQLGTGHAVLQTRSLIKGSFLALNGDDLYSREDLEALAAHEAAALVREVGDPRLYGVYQVDRDGRVIDLEEKPERPKGNLANVGCYKLPVEIFEYLERTELSERGEIEITSAIRDMAQRRPVYTVPLKGRWLPTGYACDLLKNTRSLWDEGAFPRFHVDPSARIDPAARLVEPVYVGPGCELGPGAIVGAYSVLVGQCKVEAGARVLGSVVMSGASVGAGAVVLHSVLGGDARVAACAQTLDEVAPAGEVKTVVKGKEVGTGLHRLGAVIADGSYVGAGARLWPGVKLWPDVHIASGEEVRRDRVPVDFVWK